MKKTLCLLTVSGIIIAAGLVSCKSTPAPVATADGFTGENVLWRPREQMIFFLDDKKGGGFDLNFSIRDMNVYQQGPRPAYVFVVGPDGKVLSEKLIPDDGILSGKPEYQDGYFDIGMDLRYREYHRINSPGGNPPGKKRSPALTNPENLKARNFIIKVPNAGKGIYRAYVGSCWDHWISLTPNRPMSCGVYPGSGSMYIPQDRLTKAYLYVPEKTKDVSFAITEEIQPFNWQLNVTDLQGKTVASTKPRTFLNYAVVKDVKGGSVWQLNITGNTAGACLHINGLPPIICADAATARKIAGGEIINDKDIYFDPDQKVIMDWVKSLKPADLQVTGLPAPGKIGSLDPKTLMTEINNYQTQPGLAKYGMLTLGWRNNQILPYVTDPKSNYYNNAAMIRRIWVHVALSKVQKLDPTFSFAGLDYPKNIDIKSAFQLVRSSWWPLNDLSHAEMLEPLRELSKQHIPSEVINAMNNLFLKWALSRMTMEQGLCSNQWTYDLKDMACAAKFSNDPKILDALDFNVKRFCMKNNLGRSNPDKTPYSDKSHVRYTYSSDTGRIGGGVPAECLGHDSEYCLESNMNMAKVWEEYKYPEIVEWLDDYYVTKTWLTLPKTSAVPKAPFSDTCSPTDMNTRTRYYTHKSGIGKIHDLITYGPIWEGRKGKKTWPCMQPGTFFKNIDNRWFFVKTPTYYAIVFGGAGEPDSLTWTQSELTDNSAQLVGIGGMGYGGYQRAKKAGGFSAIWLPECGPVSVGSNHNVMYSNTVWGRVDKPLYQKWADNVDPRMVAECFSSPAVDFTANGHRYVKTGEIPHTPLQYVRTIELKNDAIEVTMKLTAAKAVQLSELNESIPLFLNDRTLAYCDKDGFITCKLPKYLVTPTHESLPGIYNGINPEIKPFKARQIKLTAPNGSGMLIEFPGEYNIRVAQPLRYRNDAATMSGLIISLPESWTKNQTRTLKYKINIISAVKSR